ncbi:tyrosine-type recombinase/integrase [Streptomyces anulatus]|uniref:tyrosine-type recombinase/integrase n=1 Tax=Streptomyces anulatus TaxID=1892 RepID=UPI003865B99F
MQLDDGFSWRKLEELRFVGCGRPSEAAQPVSLVHPGRRHRRVSAIRLHDARHGCATLLTAAGFAPRVVMEILGHSQIAVTMNIYVHVVQDTQREAVSHLDRMLRQQRPDRG